MNSTYIMLNTTKKNKRFTSTYSELSKALKDYETLKEWSQAIMIIEVETTDVKVLKKWNMYD